jgi:hypothetical protein
MGTEVHIELYERRVPGPALDHLILDSPHSTTFAAELDLDEVYAVVGYVPKAASRCECRRVCLVQMPVQLFSDLNLALTARNQFVQRLFAQFRREERLGLDRTFLISFAMKRFANCAMHSHAKTPGEADRFESDLGRHESGGMSYIFVRSLSALAL